MQSNDIGFVFAGYSDLTLRTMFKDCLNREDVKILKEILPFSEYVNGLFRGLAMRCYKYKFCQSLLYVVESVFRPLEKLDTDDKKTYLIFTNAASIGLSVPYFKKFLQRHKNYIPVMLFMDQLNLYWAKYAKYLVEQIPQFQCFTFDPQDAQNKDYKHTMSVYSYYDAEPGGVVSDIYFSFFGLNRLKTIIEIADYLEARQVRCNFIYVGDMDDATVELGTVKQVSKRLLYSEIVRDAAQANCLLEVQRDGQSGATLRYYEAICYNKKLLTTNKNVVNLPFYNPEYMKVFEKPSDIDYDWVRRRDPVDYHYDNRFSPVHFLEEIIDSANRED